MNFIIKKIELNQFITFLFILDFMGNNGSQSEYKNKNSEQYIGELKENKRNGKGTYIYSNGDRYEGNWLNDFRDGKGTFYYQNGELYIGEWFENC